MDRKTFSMIPNVEKIENSRNSRKYNYETIFMAHHYKNGLQVGQNLPDVS
jgi:hypothetical protein